MYNIVRIAKFRYAIDLLCIGENLIFSIKLPILRLPKKKCQKSNVGSAGQIVTLFECVAEVGRSGYCMASF